MNDADADGGLPLPQRRLALAALILSTAMATLDINIANTALPAIARDLDISPADSIWIVNVYQIATVASLFTFAALGQRVGPTRVYRAGVVAFLVASLVCALSRSVWMLVFGRFLQGLGASAVFGIGPALYREVFPKNQLGRGLGINAMIVAVSTASGPTVGGLILAVASWPWIYAINVPFGLANLVLNRALPPGARRPGALDVPSIAASAIGFALVVAGLNSLSRPDEVRLTTFMLVVGVVVFVWFVHRQSRLAHPLLATELFRIPAFSLAGATSFTGFAAQGLAYVCLPYELQRGLGVTPLDSALLMSSWPVMLGVTSPFAGRLSDRLTPGLLATIGLGLMAVGLALYALLPPHPTVLAIVVNGAICGVGFGLFKSPNDRELMMNAPRALSSSASGILAAMRTSGQSVGAASVAIAFAAFGASVTGAAGDAAVVAGAQAALWVATGCALLAAVVSASRLRTRPMEADSARG